MIFEMAKDRQEKKGCIYPVPCEIRKEKGLFAFKEELAVHIYSEEDMGIVVRHLEILRKHYDIGIKMVSPDPENAQGCLQIYRDRDYAGFDEGYILNVTEAGIEIIGADSSGIIYGIQTLLQMINKEKDGSFTVPAARISDHPFKQFRGVHLYMPARESIEGFKRLLRMLAFLKFNTLILEVGGGMEYEKHPEINAKWEKFCTDAMAYPGGPRGLQASQAYWKDSTHTELGGGSFLTKLEVLDLAAYAKECGLEIIPEIQGLSHSYYLTMAHREISERPQEPFPDTYCPSDPRSYELYFDVANEVLEVFKPGYVSIGHDEVRILGECERCRDKSGEELLAGDINRLYEFYRSKGVKVMMWGEKLQNFLGYDGIYHGGAFEENTDAFGRYWRVPETWKAIDMIPRDILMLDWIHALSGSTELGFRDKGFSVVFGNFEGSMIADWDIRSMRGNVLGAEVSTWCFADEFTIARNNTLFEFVFSAGILWNGNYSDNCWEEKHQQASLLMPKIREMLTGNKFPFLHTRNQELKKFFVSESPDGSVRGDTWLKSAILDPDCSPVIIDACAKSLVFFHASAKSMGFIPSWNFSDMKDYILGRYEVYFADGSIETIDLHYGIQIGCIDTDWGRFRSIDSNLPETVDILADNRQQEERTLPHYYTPNEGWRGSLLYFTLPIHVNTPEGRKTIFAYEWLSPKPDVPVRHVKPAYVTGDTSQKIYLFGIAGTV